MTQDLVPFSGSQLSLIRQTVAKDANETEFNWFIANCQLTRLNPLKKHCYLFIFHKDNPKKRQPVIVTAIDGFRAIAERSGSYRPDNRAPRITYDENLSGPLNPEGIIKAEVDVYKWSHGEWHAVTGTAHWKEFAPIRHKWADDPESGKRVRTEEQELDPGKEGWTRMPNLMIAKVAESQALRKGWPEDLSSVYGNEETHQEDSRILDLTATEVANGAEREARQSKLGGPAILVDWCDGEPLQRVPVGQFHAKVDAFIKAHMKKGEEEAAHVLLWRSRNAAGLREYWGLEKDGALTLKKRLEEVESFQKGQPQDAPVN